VTWYDKWYTPNNATLVVVGDVAPEQVFAEAEKYFGSIAAHLLPTRKPQLEPPQRASGAPRLRRRRNSPTC
jgi:zinc protease